ncbi:MAG: tetratricopeptide repeat protein [Promethearchaeota archaeon]|jgi:tetratricopeptide (TPR) repeat protein/DNA-binding MarR family transcriptional regulator
MSTRDNLVSVEDRILLYLLRRNTPKYTFNVPFALTRMGIAESISANCSYASIPLKELIKKGYIKQNTGRVNFCKRSQRYFLITDKGKKIASKLSMELSNEYILLKISDNMKKTLFLDEIIPYSNENEKCPKITEMDVYTFTTKERILDIEVLKKNKKKQIVDFSSEAPMIVHFYGRKKEMATLKEWVSDENNNIIFIHGIPGIGKTTLVAKLLEDYRQTKNLFWHDFQELDSLHSVLSKLAEFLSELGYPDLEIQLHKHRKLDCLEISNILKKIVRSLDVILVFDDFHKANDAIRDFFGYFQKIFTPPSKLNILILSREILPFYDLRDVIKSRSVAELELEGLDFESCKQLLKDKNIEKDDYKNIYKFTAGIPLFLEVIESKDSIDRYLYELFSNLKEHEKNILEIISIFRYPVSDDCISSCGDFSFDTLLDLTNKSIVKKDVYDRYFIHDIIKSYFYKNIPSSKLKSLHLSAARWLEERENPIEILESIYHYFYAEDYENASELVINYSSTILESGLTTELLGILDGVDEKRFETGVWMKILMIKGKAYNMMGEWKKALQNYNYSTDIANLTGDKTCEGNALCESGYILEEQNELEKALRYFNKSLEVSQKINNQIGVGSAYHGIGRIYWRREDRKKAILNFKESLKIAEKMDNLELMASVYIDMGNVYDEQSETEKAIECYNKSLNILKKVNNTFETSRALANLGITYRNMGEYYKAIEYYNEQLIIAQQLHDVKQLGYGYAGLSYCYANVKEFEKTREYLEKAEKIALKLENENIMNVINRTHSIICIQEERWDDGIKYCKKSLVYLEKLGASYQLPNVHKELGLMYKEKGEPEIAEKHMKIAEGLYNKL